MRICSRCVLPETFPTIEFNDEGLCNYCRSYRGEKHQEEVKNEYREKLRDWRENTKVEAITMFSWHTVEERTALTR